MSQLVLSVFPGIGLLDMAFEEEGFCVVRGPDLLWGGDIQRFHPPYGKFDGVIGGPPCQAFSALRSLVDHNGHRPRFGNLIPEFERCVAAAQPAWFLMENVRGAPLPAVPGYIVRARLLRDSAVGGVQPRVRRFSFGTLRGAVLPVEELALEGPVTATSVCGHGGYLSGMRSVTGDARQGSVGSRVRHGRGGVLPHVGKAAPLADMLVAQGLPPTWLDGTPLTSDGKRDMVGNGVPLMMGRAVARAVKRALGLGEVSA